jgi:hypothetical protein
MIYKLLYIHLSVKAINQLRQPEQTASFLFSSPIKMNALQLLILSKLCTRHSATDCEIKTMHKLGGDRKFSPYLRTIRPRKNVNCFFF